MVDRGPLLRAIAAQEALRGTVPDEVIDTAVAALKSQLDSTVLAEAAKRRGQATVLFADVAGFTAMSEDLDAEVVAGLMNDLWRVVDQAIVSNGGDVDKHIGDAVLGVWGATVAREDDAERAVRAALDLRSVFSSFRSEHDLDINVRVGVNTGPVYFGGVGSVGERSVTGDAVNVASRAEHAAPAGGVLITHDTYRHVRGVFDVQRRDPIQVKGKRDPLLTYEVQRVKERSFRSVSRGVEGIETELIGRDTELGMLRHAYLQSLGSGSAHAVGVVGEAGVGKSRLLSDFTNWLDLRPEKINYLKGRSVPASNEVPLALLRDVFTRRLEIRQDDNKQEAIRKLVAGLAPLTTQEAQVAGHWLGFDLAGVPAVEDLLGSDQFATIARSHVVRFVRHLAEDDPTVILIEDVHWADDDSLDTLTAIIEMLADTPLLLVWASRPPFLDRRPEWDDGPSDLPLLRLAPLSPSDVRALTIEILQRADHVPDRVVELVQDQADGNPFHVEELLKVLIDQGVVAVSDERSWRIDETRLSQISVPPTLSAVMQARLDSLDAPERATLQCASIIGRTFWDDAVVELLTHFTRSTTATTSASEALETVRRHELVRRRTPSSFSGSTEYLFKHALLRDVAYETVLLQDRRDLHAVAADWTRRRAGDRLEEYLGPIAEHLQHAGKPDEAAEHLRLLAARARNTGSLQRAANAYERLLELSLATTDDRDTTSIEIQIELSDIYTDLGHADAAIASAERADREASRTGNDLLRAMALNARFWASVRFGRWDDAAACAQRVKPFVSAQGGAALGRFLLAESLMALDGPERDIGRAEAAALEALERWREVDAPVMEIRAINCLGNTLVRDGRLAEGDDWWRLGLEIAQRIGDRHAEMLISSNRAMVGHLHAREGRNGYADVIANYERAVQRARELGDRNQVQVMNLAQAQTEAGMLNDGLRTIRAALQSAWAVRNRWEILAALTYVGQHRIAAGRRDEGLAIIGAALAEGGSATMRQEVDAILEMYDIDEATAEAGLAAGARTPVDQIVEQFLSEVDEARSTHDPNPAHG